MSKSHPKIFSILFFFFFQNKSRKRSGGAAGGEPSFVGNESDSHKMCFSELRGLFYILWHEDTKRKPFSGSLVGPHTLLGWKSLSPPFQSQRLLSHGLLSPPCASPLCFPKPTSYFSKPV